MIDLCPRCRIQAPHRPGRERCPRCGGPLTVVRSTAEAAAVVTGAVRPPPPTTPRPPMPPGTPRPHTPPAPHGTVGDGRTASRFYRSGHVRWVARRPAETIPPRPQGPRRGPRPIPRYAYIPMWGLRDRQASDDPAATSRDPRDLLVAGFQIAGAALAASAAAHLLRYILLVVNRSTPLPQWLIWVSTALVIAAGVVALLSFGIGATAFARWVIGERVDAYRSAGRRDPRRRWLVAALAVIPLVNVVGAPLLLHEAAAARAGEWSARGADGLVRRRLNRLWVAWVLVNALAAATAITIWVAYRSGSIQTGANALLLVAVTAAVSSAFAFWAAERLPRVFGTVDEEPPARRWVPIA